MELNELTGILNVTWYSVAASYSSFRRTCSLHLQYNRIRKTWLSGEQFLQNARLPGITLQKMDIVTVTGVMTSNFTLLMAFGVLELCWWGYSKINYTSSKAICFVFFCDSIFKRGGATAGLITVWCRLAHKAANIAAHPAVSDSSSGSGRWEAADSADNTGPDWE